ncbi:MAG: protein kinase, partial [Chloroflexota bacterium]|nr:protein kinase [Chloroflexota bacterium]
MTVPGDERQSEPREEAQTRIAPGWYGDDAARPGGWHGMLDLRGEVLGERYVVEQEIGSGAFSITYRGHDERLGRTVAIKVLRPNYALDPTYVQRFEREARTAASVSQGNVVDVYDFGRHRELLYIVMQYVEGEDLKHLIVREGPLAPRRAVEIARQVLAGLAAIHHAGIIHRDIKPQNVMIGND